MSDERADHGATCPRCDAPIDGETGACPECGLRFLDEAGDLSDEAIQTMVDEADVSLPEGPAGRPLTTPAPVRLLVGLAISAPLAPILVFVAVSIAPLSLWASASVFLLGWALAGYGLARNRVPTRIVADGLVLLGLVLASAPVLIVGGRAVLGTDASEIGALGSNVFAAQVVFLLFGLLVLGAGAFVRRHAIATEARWERERGPEER